MNFWIQAICCSVIVAVTIVTFYRGIRTNVVWVGFLPFLYGFLWTGVSVVVLDHGYFITEQGAWSRFTGAGIRYWLYVVPFVMGFWVAAQRSLDRETKLLSVHLLIGIRVLLCGLLMAQFILMANALVSPKAWLSPGIDRWNFWDNSRWPFLQIILGQVFFPGACMGGALLAVSYRLGARTEVFLCLAGAAAHMMFLLLMGQKYNGFIPILMAYGLPMIILHPGLITQSLLKRWKTVLLVGVLLAGILGLVVFWFSSNWTNSRMALSPLGNLAYRLFVLQGHAYWGVDNLYFNESVSTQQGWLELKNSDYNGVEAVMQLVGDPNLVKWYFERGVRFATVHPSLSLLLFGWAGLVGFQLLFGYVAGLVSRSVVVAVYEYRPLILACGLTTIINLYGLNMMGDLGLILSPKVVLPLLVLLGAYLIGRMSPRGSQEVPRREVRLAKGGYRPASRRPASRPRPRASESGPVL